MTEGIAGMPEGGPGSAGEGVLSGAAAGAAGLDAAASVSIAVVGSLRATLAYEDVAAVLRGLGCWQLRGIGVYVGGAPAGASGRRRWGAARAKGRSAAAVRAPGWDPGIGSLGAR